MPGPVFITSAIIGSGVGIVMEGWTVEYHKQDADYSTGKGWDRDQCCNPQ